MSERRQAAAREVVRVLPWPGELPRPEQGWWVLRTSGQDLRSGPWGHSDESMGVLPDSPAPGDGRTLWNKTEIRTPKGSLKIGRS